MNQVNGITSQPVQVLGLTLEDGSRATVTLYFRPQQNGWFFDLQWPGPGGAVAPYTTLGRRLVTSPNLLRQARELIPFGVACFTPDNADPSALDDFSDGSAVLVVLNASDVAAVEAAVFAPLT